MRSGICEDGRFCSFRFHDQIQTEEILVESTDDHPHVVKVTHKDGFVEYAFWDESDLAAPGGATFEEAVKSFDDYCKYYLGA